MFEGKKTNNDHSSLLAYLASITLSFLEYLIGFCIKKLAVAGQDLRNSLGVAERAGFASWNRSLAYQQKQKKDELKQSKLQRDSEARLVGISTSLLFACRNKEGASLSIEYFLVLFMEWFSLSRSCRNPNLYRNHLI